MRNQPQLHSKENLFEDAAERVLGHRTAIGSDQRHAGAPAENTELGQVRGVISRSAWRPRVLDRLPLRQSLVTIDVDHDTSFLNAQASHDLGIPIQ
jgi:hypothetical protein